MGKTPMPRKRQLGPTDARIIRPMTVSTDATPPPGVETDSLAAATAWRVGTMGFSYDDWNGPFYPSSVRQADRLSFYARHFDSIELDTTFYATPPADRVARWAAAVPDGFRFCLKTPRAVTHEGHLAGNVAAMRQFEDAVRGFGPKLGAVLIQFPPTFTADRFAETESFLATLPSDIRFAVEFRHRSWGTPDALRMLYDRQCSFVSAEYAARPVRVFATADFLYLRGVGVHNQFPKHEAELVDPTDRLEWWREAVQRTLPKVKVIYGFFNNDYAGYSIATANRFKRMLGLPTREPRRVETMELFGDRG